MTCRGWNIGRIAKRVGTLSLLVWGLGTCAVAQAPTHKSLYIHNDQVWISLPSVADGHFWKFGEVNGTSQHQFSAPVFEIDGKLVPGNVRRFSAAAAPMRLADEVTEYDFEGVLVHAPHLKLIVQFQINETTPVIRFRYILTGDGHDTLTAVSGRDRLTYLQTSLNGLPDAEEVSLSTFDELTHSYTLSERAIEDRDFQDGSTFMGPILAASDGHRGLLLAYEHGSSVPDEYLHYQLGPGHSVSLTAVKGNYLPDQPLDVNHDYRTIWMETATVQGDISRLASTFRTFVLNRMAPNTGSRIPYIFYNTWNFQERNKWWNGRSYLESMNEDRILKEIDVAHRMGIEVFVLDTGWYEKTGDWSVDTARFPDGLKAVKAKLDEYGMKLGLWIGPLEAAASSKVVREHPEWRISWDGKVTEPHDVWGTEGSYWMCLESGYADALASELIRLAKETGARYFKWDGISQYGCNDPHHNHGDAHNTAQERADSYSFQLIQYMNQIADKVAAAAPGTIIDFDITEDRRPVGLAFLSSGRYFLMNNGPYYKSYDLPIDQSKTNSNLFFRQGPARTWIARTPLTFDKWIPSILFLVHYFPDDPQQWQEQSVASLILGQDGIWGDLLSVSNSGVDYIGGILSRYKQVCEDITESDPVVSGIVSGSPEIHEKLSATTGRGAVVIFSTEPGTFRYVTTHRAKDEYWATDGVKVNFDASGRASIEAAFEKPGAKIVFFGAR
jgi:alpha-galactosidase